MPLEEFRIELDNPTSSYFTNQSVTGRIILNTLHEESPQGLEVKLQGRAKVYWQGMRTYNSSYNSPETVIQVQVNTPNLKTTENLVDLNTYVLGDGQSIIKIPAGQSVYPFTFQLTQNLPSSYVGAHGKVWYEVEASMNRSLTFDHKPKRLITVNAILDLNENPELAESCEHREEKQFGFLGFREGRVGFLIKLPTQGYVPGQNVTPVVEIYNQSSKTITVSVELVQNAALVANRKIKHSLKTVASARRHGVGPGDTDIWQGNVLQIPSVPPSKLGGGCKIIDVKYSLKFEAHVSGMGSNFTKSVPITIGTIPFLSAIAELSE